MYHVLGGLDAQIRARIELQRYRTDSRVKYFTHRGGTVRCTLPGADYFVYRGGIFHLLLHYFLLFLTFKRMHFI
jgi:hypothetical protein